ncbi:MAG: autotransporter outer membrane beta-barrel domain-containing protein, partial [Zoogloeaceae bacterium]|nr:autotransporter outer membrane beta-barrel domain-containing protein [Zoogloeaceae bacterium]
MNRCYKTVLNRSLGIWQVVSETAKARGKAGRNGQAVTPSVARAGCHHACPSTRLLAPLLLSMAAAGLFSAGAARANCVNITTGEQVTGGIGVGTGQPTSGQTVVCDSNPPNPTATTTTVSALPGSTGVSVTVLAGASMNPTTRAIGIEDNSTVLIQGTVNTNGGNFAYGVNVTGSGNTVTNEGIVNTTGTNANGLNISNASVTSNNTLENTGAITVSGSGASGIRANAALNTTIINSGSISASGGNSTTQRAAGVLVTAGSSGTFTNQAGGSVAAQSAGGVEIQTSNFTVTNAGTIGSATGVAVLLGAANNTLILETGSVLNGEVLTDVATGNVLRLRESGSEDSNFAGAGFEQLTMGDANTVAGDEWMLSGIATITGAVADAVSVDNGTLRIADAGIVNTVNGGGTTVGNGATLRVDGALGDAGNLSMVTVASGGALGGNGVIRGNVTVADGGIFAPHTAGGADTSMLTINGHLTLNDNSILNYNFGQAGAVGAPFNDLAIVQGNLTLNGILNVAETASGSFLPGIYRIITYGGTLTDNGLAIGALPVSVPAGTASIQTSVKGEVDLVYASQPLTFWNGGDPGLRSPGTVAGGNGGWQSSSGNDNWTNQNGTTQGAWADNSFAIFEGAPGVVTVDNSLGAVMVSGMQFDANGYRIQGDVITLVDSAAAPGQSIIRVGAGDVGANYVATIAAELTGNVQLVKTDLGTLTLTGINTYDGGTSIEGGVLRVSSDDNLGAAAGGLSFDGGTLNTTATFSSARNVGLTGLGGVFDTNAGTTLELTGGITGIGGLSKTGAGALLFNPAGIIDYTGDTVVNQGILRAGAAGVLSAVSSHQINPAGTLDLAGFDQTAADLTHAGFIDFGANTPPGTTFTVTGDYTGNNGLIAINTVLGDDGSPTDKLIVEGDTSGTTRIRIVNAGGAGGRTTGNGIEVVQVDGNSGGIFSLAGRVSAGAYEYNLFQGGIGASAANGDWYLRSIGYRPEVGDYLDNRYTAMRSQWHTLHDRQTQAPGMIGQGGKQGDKPDANSWIRIQASESNRDTNNFKNDNRQYLLHAGSDLARWDKDQGSLRLGLMGMIHHSSGNTHVQELKSRHSVDGYSGGLYATWYGNNDPTTGLWIDAWLMGGRFDNTIHGDNRAKETYQAKVYAASLEAGYGITVHENKADGTRIIVQPQAQVISSTYRAGKHTEKQSNGGTVVSKLNDNELTTRLGVRLYADLPKEGGRLRPFAEANWWHGQSSHDMAFNADQVKDKLPGNIWELKLGLEGNATKNLSLWGALGAQGGRDYRNHTLYVGMK